MYGHTLSQSTSLKKRALYKVSMFLLAFMIAFASFIQTQQKVQANPLVIPGGIVIGAGTYTVGALALAGLVGVVGYDQHSEAINAHAKEVWNTNTTAASESLKLSLDLAKGAGTGLVNLQGDFINFIDGQLAGIASNTASLVTPAITNGNYTFWGTDRFTDMYAEQGSGNAFASSKGTYTTLQIFVDQYMISATLSSPTKPIYPNHTVTIRANTQTAQYNALYNQIKSALSLKTYSSQISAAAAIGISATTVRVEEWESNRGIIENQVNEAWTSMRDAGLVLPVDGATAYSGDKVVTHNPTSDTYTDDAGMTYAPGDVTWSFPQPRIRTENVPVPGVYVDTPALTGNPAIDTTITGNPAIPKTTTNVYTGTTIANPDMPATPGPTPTPEPTPTPKPLPRVPGSGAPVPALIFMAFFDLLRALLMYLVRMFNWIMTVPFVAEKPIDNEYFQWFRQAKILGVYPYTLVTGMATFFLGFKLVKAVRSFLP